MENGPVIYDFLKSLGMRTSKSVWPIKGVGEAKVGGSTCEEAEYREWTRGLQQDGFEIALHNVTYNNSPRAQIVAGLDTYFSIYGSFPRIQVNHSDCRDCLYWGTQARKRALPSGLHAGNALSQTPSFPGRGAG